MKNTYSIDFSGQAEEKDLTTGQLPHWCSYPISFAKQTTRYKVEDAELILQRASIGPFNIDLYDIKNNKSWVVPFKLEDKKQLFLFFLFKGSIRFSTPDKRPIARVTGSKFLISFYDCGTYWAEVARGKSTVLVVNICIDWLEQLSSDYPKLAAIIKEYYNESKTARIMLQCLIDNKVKTWLQKIYINLNKNAIITESAMSLYLSSILEHYNYLLGTSQTDPVYNVLHYIDDHYRDSDLSIDFLTQNFFITKRTLLKRFKEEFDTTPYQYITLLRMQYAKEHIEKNGESVDQVYIRTGYNNENAFRIAYKKFKESEPL